MPCESTVQTEGLMVASAASQSLGASGGPHQVSRFHVCHVTQACQDPQLHSDEADNALATIDHKCEELHMAVGILDSLPWCRGGHAAAAAAVAAAFRAIPELAEDRADAAAADAATAAAGMDGLGDIADGCTMTAQMAKSISQLRMSASSSNFPSLECRCSVEGPATSTCDCGGQREVASPPPPPPPPPPESAAMVDAEVTEDGASHLDPPWSHSHNSCCLSSSHRPTSPAASMRHMAVSHRSERVCGGGGPTTAVRSGSFRRRPSSAAQHHQQHHLLQHHQLATSGDCSAASAPPLEVERRDQSYPEYLHQLQERVQLWLLGTACSTGDESSVEEGAVGCCDSMAVAAGYCYGNRRATMPDNHTHNDHWSEH